METMQFRDYIFPHNPESIAVSSPAALVGHFCPGVGEVVQNLGRKGRRVVCRGCFFGESYGAAAARLQAFRQRAEGEGGMLAIPGMQPFFAYLQELAFEARGDGRIIAYAMTFQEGRQEDA